MDNKNSSTSNFKQFIKYLALVLVCSISVGILFSYLFERVIIFENEISGAYKVNRMLKESYKDEVAILGTSRAEGSYVPSILGNHYFNYGMSGIHSVVWLFMLEEELKKSKNSSVIINIDLNGFKKAYGDIGYYIPNYAKTKHLVGKEQQFYYNIAGFKYYGHYTHYFKDFLNNKMNLTKHTDKGGSFEKNQLPSKQFEAIILKRKKLRKVFYKNEQQYQKLNELIDKTNRKIFFVIAPYHPSFFENFDNLEEAKALLTALDNKPNVSVIDFGKVDYPDELFFNTTHLNYKGAKRFSQELKSLLNKSN